MSLDCVQRKASLHNRGPAMILAGPGSGKTTVITHRINNLINLYKTDSRRILVITFTKMAALEMKERFEKMNGSSEVTFGTFHAVFFMILKKVYDYNATDIVKTGQQRRFIKTQLVKYGISVRDEQDYISDILSDIAKKKASQIEDMKSIEDMNGMKDMNGMENVKNMEEVRALKEIAKKEQNLDKEREEIFNSIYLDYNKWLNEMHMVDFEDMMIKTYRLLMTDESELKYWQNRYDYILVDEFQDASLIQYRITQLLAEKHRNIFIVGDDDQSIYGFRGSAPSVMKKFVSDYRECVTYRLDINYRSCSDIVQMATKLINNNNDRYYKELKAYNILSGSIDYMTFDNSSNEYKQIAMQIKKRMAEGEHVAVLTRTNSVVDELVEIFEKADISVYVNKKKKSVLKHWIAEDIAAYVNLVCKSNKRRDYLRIINKPVRYISWDFFLEEDVDIEKLLVRLGQSDRTKVLYKRMKQLIADINIMKNMKPYVCISYILKVTGYQKYIEEYCSEQNADINVLNSIIEMIQDKARECKTLEELRLMFEGAEDENSIEKDKQDDVQQIQIFTMHGAKGLEFDTVYIIDVNEGNIPYHKATEPEQIEEERRLFYVAITRAKKRLVICSCLKNHNKNLQPSRFVKELQA